VCGSLTPSGQGVADRLPIGVIVADLEGSATFANRAWSDITGQGESDWTGKGWLDVLRPADRDRALSALVAAIKSGMPYDCDWSATHLAQSARRFHVSAVPDLDSGMPLGFLATFTDVTEECARGELLLHRATHDSLTGLYNRSQFLEFVAHALDRQRRKPLQPLGVLFVDVDGLKFTNDRFGHDAGDRLLRVVAAHLCATVRPSDIVARYGGDEFTVLCEDLRDVGEAASIANRVRFAARASDDMRDEFRLSIGVATAEDPNLDPAEIVHRADEAMYQARHDRHGRPEPLPARVKSPSQHLHGATRPRPDDSDWESSRELHSSGSPLTASPTSAATAALGS
jgi:diguanylate cyclase (GGDEF)-like protein/PAS domain S-box-containing protein